MISMIQKTRMVEAAFARDGDEILPCDGCRSFFEGFREYPKIGVILFYQVPGSETTHCVFERDAANNPAGGSAIESKRRRLIVPFYQRPDMRGADMTQRNMTAKRAKGLLRMSASAFWESK
ncbi:hypothetical protein ES705_42949 [subsurface metagenome]